MNISTGGPHILLFERDQQLTALIMSEFQLAGYECHTARTAVEVFDALARYPVRIVLVDLAQAAAARREFWVALDTQRRGRGIHVLTFRCSNIAGYGPHDPEERSQNNVADLDIDGMMGLMKLVDEVRTRVPIAGSITNTMPRLSRIAPTPQPAAGGLNQRTGGFAPIATTSGTSTGANISRNAVGTENGVGPSPTRNMSGIYSQSTINTQAVPQQTTSLANNRAGLGTTPQVMNTVTNSMTSTGSQKAISYTDKIRAVLYPNQRNWSTQASPPAQPSPEPQPIRTIPENNQPSASMNSVPMNNAPVLQRLATGQVSQAGTTDAQAESGLAQLSRLAHANYAPISSAQTYETSNNNYSASSEMSTIPEIQFIQSTMAAEQASITKEAINSTPTTDSPEQTRETTEIRPLRASPIQDIPVDRPGNQTNGESNRRPDVLSRTNYGQQQVSATLPPLASITASPPQPQGGIQARGGTTSIPYTPPVTPIAPKTTTEFPVEEREYERKSTNPSPEVTTHISEEANDNDLEDPNSLQMDSFEKKPLKKRGQEKDNDDNDTADNQNSMLFDIMQSLPPMPPVGSQSQTVQAQVLNGRATRSLGSVLLAGHLVPQNRLEVAQNIQRMLCGVDLNYQLGEILLMFKLLTPDQLLAASLVSYGMITTIQVSALGRIRQELHSIGLEYDLESLLILFRILTPEQLREAKSGMQG